MNRKRIFICSLTAVFLLVAGVIIWKLDIASWQKLDIEKITALPASTKVLDRNGNAVNNLYSVRSSAYTPLETLPEYIPQAFIAAEDARFFQHHGVDVRRIFGALWHNIRAGKAAQGASTITQQLIKLTHLSSEKTIARKAQEAYLALSLERKMEKNEILEAYLNTVYFGSGAYGIGAAAEIFFGKDAASLTLGESALLAGIIKSPTGYSPFNNPDAAKKRREYVLSAMAENGFISKGLAESAAREQFALAENKGKETGSGWYMDMVAAEAQEILDLDADEIFSGGYVIQTALNPDMQSKATEIIERESVYPDGQAQGALIAMDPSSGEILSVVGGRKYEVQRGLNRAKDSRRQTGSVIKPISTYAAAVDKYGYLPTSRVYDVQREYAGGYSPGNAGGEFSGAVTMRTALSRSLNAATVDLADTIGMETVCSYAENFGISLDKSDRNLSFALGSMAKGATPAEICSAYCVLANGGRRILPHSIRRIEDRYGNIVYECRGKSEEIISKKSAYVITDMLKTAASSGTARVLSGLPFPVAAKTGTAGLENGDTSDAWTCAYTPDIAVTVWMGRDSNAGGGMAPSVTGGGWAAPVCAEFLQAATPHLSCRDFPMPGDITAMLVDGYLLETTLEARLISENTPTKYCAREIFTDETIPNETSDIWNPPAPVEDFAVHESPSGKPQISFTYRESLAEYMIIRESCGKSEVATVLRGNPGEKIVWEDASADDESEIYYTVIPRHSLLYENGQLLTASHTTRIRYGAGFLDGITHLLSGDEDIEHIESGEFPIF